MALILPFTDIHILVNTAHAPSIYNSPASASWIPVCLPKYNPAAFVNAYISFLWKPEHNKSETPPENAVRDSEDAPSSSREEGQHSTAQPDSSICLLCISGGGEFETVRSWCDSVAQVYLYLSDRCAFTDTIAQKLNSQGTLNAITHAMESGQGQYLVSQLGIPGLRHFVYKSRPHVQITFPIFEDPYDTEDEKRRLVVCR